MLTARWITEGGARWRILEGSGQQGQATLQHLRTRDLSAPLAETLDGLGQPAWIKGSALAGKAALRHGLRFRLGLGLPRLREARNLAWLRRHLFQAPAPLAAVALFHHSLPRGQWLVTQAEQDAQPLLAVWDALDATKQDQTLQELAQEVARMHALGFTHRDLFLRNLMWCQDRPRKLLFLDCWRGGPGLDLRGAAWDVGCLLSDIVDRIGNERSDNWLREYIHQREVQDRPVSSAAFIPRAIAAREVVVRRLIAQPQRLGGNPPPTQNWTTKITAERHPNLTRAEEGNGSDQSAE